MLIHELSATELLQHLGSGEISSEEIVRALSDRADRLDPALGCFVHRRSKDLMTEARAADAARLRGESLGPLHGLPISIKESIDLVGTDSTMGIAARRNQPSFEDAPVVRLLKDAGGLVLGKTNVPQLLLAQETENALWGATSNPWNRSRVPGGSSGGEAAAIASGLSPCGVGTDIGGSIRIPAHFCGLAGLKPTLDRWSNRGSNGAVPGQELVRSQMGPIARTTGDLRLLLEAVSPLRLADLDPAVAPLPWGDPDSLRPESLRVGVFTDDGYLTPAPAVQRAVREARAILDAAGVTVVEYLPPAPHALIYIWLGAISADGGRTIDAQLEGETISPQLKPSRATLRLPTVARKAMALVLDRFGETRLARLLESLGEKRVDDLWRLTADRTALRLAEFDAWNAHRLDAVICPPHVVPAMGHRESGDFTLSLSYAFRWTLLNFPAGVVPVTRVRGSEAAAAAAASVPGLDRVEKKVAAIAAAGAGLPLGVQVVARPFREDVALALMELIETGARSREGFPRTPVDPGTTASEAR